ncbi:hypothetical protein Tco_0977882 [Tanacetum coccineum]|uniref:Uncharacterized protein n=1 Tax=Tanacetum coccineum TaxID=301880 RepID=A0ABQ5ELF7_9ASTR
MAKIQEVLLEESSSTDQPLEQNEENKTILKQLKKANASLTQELKECRTNLDETGHSSRAPRLEEMETLRLLARKDIDIKKGLKTKADEISVVNQKHDELVKKSLLTKSQFEGKSVNGQKQQRIDLNADALYNAKQENLRVWLQKMLISKKPVPECSSLVLHPMTSDHNSSELGIQDHINEQSSSKLVPKVVP